MIMRFCPGYSYARKCDRNCDECKNIVLKNVPSCMALKNYSGRPPVAGYGRAEDIKIIKTTPADAGAVKEVKV